MSRLDRELRKLDPIDPGTPEPSGEHLLQRIIAEPASPVRRPVRRRLLGLAPVSLAGAVIAAVLIVIDFGGGEEREVPAPAGGVPSAVDPDSILHYTQRWTFRGSGPAIETETREVWQAGDGSRLRVVYRPADTATFDYAERVTTKRGWREFVEHGGPREIHEYDESAPGSLGAPAGYGLPASVGDPRTLPARAAAGERGVERLGAASVRDVRVERFRTGTCPRTADVSDPIRHPGALRSAEADRPLIVSVAHDPLRPVRVETLPCEAFDAALGPPAPLQTHVDAPKLPWAATDYLSFELLPPTPENRRLLDMAPHPGARVVSSKAIDRAEERDESDRSAAPTVTPAPTPR